MATNKSIDDVIIEIKSTVEADPRGLKRMRKSSFLKRLGIRRLTQQRRDEIDGSLAREGLFLQSESGQAHWGDSALAGNLTFSLVPRAPKAKSKKPTRERATKAPIVPKFNQIVTDLLWWTPFADKPADQPASPRRHRDKSESNRRSRHPALESSTKQNPNIAVQARIEGSHPDPLFRHQQEALRRISDELGKCPADQPFAGLLVIPTGGGKTRTTVEWLMKNVISKNGKVLWIAHRTELLNQAFHAFRTNAYAEILGDKEKVRCHLISGQHDPGFKIHSDDDVLIASIHSVRPGAESSKHLIANWLSKQQSVYLVIDEAHHAPARTYRQLIDEVRKHSSPFRMFGLTATPFRTAQREEGHIPALFPNGMVFKTDLRTMIDRGILSSPRFHTPATGVNLRKELTTDDLDALKRRNFDWAALGERAARTIGENQIRNRAIVNEYLSKSKKYGQTLVFALNVPNALALHALFEDANVRSACVVGEVRDERGVRNISPEDNARAIVRFRNQEIQVLINVNILTEGIDLPGTQTVFLARPTTSKTLMMQMIGRGLRGKAAGGTDETHIVSFMDDDDWEDRICWVNPEQLFIEENVDFDDRSRETKERVVRLISIDMIRQYTRLLDELGQFDDLAALPFVERIPLGVYAFSILPGSPDECEKVCEILVYDSNLYAYTRFFAGIPQLLGTPDLSDKANADRLDDATLNLLADRAEDAFFLGIDRLPGYHRQDLCDLLQYYFVYDQPPEFIKFDERSKYDIDRVAKEVFRRELGGKAKVEFFDQVWADQKSGWQVFFGFEHKKYFVNEVNLALRRLEYPDMFANKDAIIPAAEHPMEELSRFSLPELRRTHPQFYSRLREQVFSRHQAKNGEYACANTGWKSRNQFDFEIDHRVPRAKGGLTTLDNLQLLRRRENRRKGAAG